MSNPDSNMASEADLSAPVVVESGVVEPEGMSSCLATVDNGFSAQVVVVAPVDVQAPVPGR